MIEFVLGRSASGKTTYLNSLIDAAVPQGKAVCLIVPEQESMMAERDFQQRYGDEVQVLSFHRLCDTLMRLYGGGAKERISEVAALGILYRAVQNVKGKLGYYRKSAGSVRFYEKLVPVMEDFAAYKAEAQVILPLLENTESYEKYKDLFLIYESYNALRAQDYRDQFDDLDTVSRLLKEYAYFEEKMVLIDHFAGFTEQEYDILESIFLQADSVALTLSADEGDALLFSPTLRHLKRLTALAESYGLAYKKTCLTGSYRYTKDNLRVLEKYLFSVQRPKDKASDDGSVRIFSASGMEEEVRLVAADIRRRVLGGECRYKNISVVSNVQQEYQHILEMVFDELDIPLYSDRKVDVLSRPLFSMILHAFDAVQYGYRFEDMFSFAKTYLCGLDYESVARLENYVYMWNIRGKKWEMEWTQSPWGLESSGDEEQKKLLLDQINAARRHLVEPLMEFAEDTRPGKATDLLAAVWRLLENFKVAESLKKFAALETSRDRREQWLRLYDLLIEMLDQLALVLGDSTITRQDLHDIMEVCLRGYRFGVVPAFMDQVHFGDMVRARSGEVKHLYVLGAAHGKFPAAVSGSSMITDRDIRHLEAQNILLSKDSVRVALEQQYCLYRTVSGASDSVTFSYSVFSADGAPQLPSALLGRITGKLLDISILEETQELTHYKDLVRLVAALSPAHPMYRQLADYLMDNFDVDVSALRTERKKEEALPREVVEALYGRELSASQSRLESFVGCPFRFFLDYGLKVKETEPVTFAANYIGDYVHYGMEKLMNAIVAEGSVAAWSDERVDALLEQVSEQYFEQNLQDMSSARFDHLYDRIRRTLRLVGRSAVEELRHSAFFPKMQEYHFEKRIPLSGDFYAKVNGFIDRVDCARIDGQKWMKIIDYKTGDKSLDLSNIYNGYQLQLPMYTKMLHRHPDFADHQVAAMEYFLAGVPRFSQDDQDPFCPENLASVFQRRGLFVAEPEIIAALDGSEGGLYNNAPIKKDGSFAARAMVADREQMSALEDFVEKKLTSVMEQMVGGDVSVCPMKQGVNACRYCNFDGICRFEYGKNKTRPFVEMDHTAFFEAIGKEEA